MFLLLRLMILTLTDRLSENSAPGGSPLQTRTSWFGGEPWCAFPCYNREDSGTSAASRQWKNISQRIQSPKSSRKIFKWWINPYVMLKEQQGLDMSLKFNRFIIIIGVENPQSEVSEHYLAKLNIFIIFLDSTLNALISRTSNMYGNYCTFSCNMYYELAAYRYSCPFSFAKSCSCPYLQCCNMRIIYPF